MRLRPAHVLAPGGAVGWCGVADFHRGTEKGEEPEVLAAVRAVRQGRPAGFRPKPRWVFFFLFKDSNQEFKLKFKLFQKP